MKVTRNYKIADVAPPFGGLASLNAVMNGIWEQRYSARTAKKVDGSLAGEGDVVETLDDEIGSIQLRYSGNSGYDPILQHEIPYLGRPQLFIQKGLITDDLPFIYLKNQEGISLASAGRYGLSETKTVGFTMLAADYSIYEAMAQVGFYLGILSGNNSNESRPRKWALRTTNDGTPVDFEIGMNGVNTFIMTIQRDGLESQPSRISCKLWCNGTLLNPNTHMETFAAYPNQAIQEGIGTSTNCQMMGVIECFYAYRVLSNQEITNTFNAQNSYYKLGVETNLPVATNMNVTKNGNMLTASYKFLKPMGFAEDVSKRKIVWESGAALQRMVQLNTVNDLISFDYTTTNAQINHPYRCNIFVKDVAGNEFKLPAVWFGSVA